MAKKTGPADRLRARCRRDLESHGVDPGFAEAIAETLAGVADETGGEFYQGLLGGVIAAYAVHRDGLERLRRSMRDLNEMGRLMDAFGGELEKLDEALRTLAAYLGRMRARAGNDTERVIH